MIHKKLCLGIGLILFCFNAIAQNNKDVKPPQLLYYLTDKDPKREVIFKYDKSYNYLGFDTDSKSTTLSEAEITQIIRLIRTRVALYNKNRNPKDRFDYIRHPEKYYKQIVPAINGKGEKIVWVACSCGVMKGYWEKGLGITNDGGNCYFQLKINLTRNSVYSFSVNGLA